MVGWTRAEVRGVLAPCLPAQVPYNMERIFWLLSGSDSQGTRALMEQFERTQSTSLPEELHDKVSHHPRTTEKAKGAAVKPNLGLEIWLREEGTCFLSTCNEAGTSAVTFHGLIY